MLDVIQPLAQVGLSIAVEHSADSMLLIIEHLALVVVATFLTDLCEAGAKSRLLHGVLECSAEILKIKLCQGS